LHVPHLPLRTVKPSSTARIVAYIEIESQKLADADVDVIVLAATAPSSRNGIRYDKELIDTASTALIQALTALEVQRLTIAAPWSEATKVTTAAFIEASGFIVLAHQASGQVSNLKIGLPHEQTVFDMGVAFDRPEAQAMILACGNWPTLGIVDRLQSAIHRPVLTTNQVSLLGRADPSRLPGLGVWLGRLLREYHASAMMLGSAVAGERGHYGVAARLTNVSTFPRIDRAPAKSPPDRVAGAGGHHD